jgi:hypothetical protein
MASRTIATGSIQAGGFRGSMEDMNQIGSQSVYKAVAIQELKKTYPVGLKLAMLFG